MDSHRDGFRFYDGKLSIFRDGRITVLTSWPDLSAVTKPRLAKRWSPFWPEYRVILPYRTDRRRTKKSRKPEQFVLDLDLEPLPDLALERKRAFDAYRFTFPKPIAEEVCKLQVGQWAVLQLIKNDPSALDLLAANPALVFGLAMAHVTPSLASKPLPEFGTARQRDLAAEIGFPGTEAAVRALRKVIPESVSDESITLLRACFEDPVALKILSHQEALNRGTIQIVSDPILREACSTKLLKDVAVSGREKYRPHVAELIHQALDMAALVAPDQRFLFTSMEQLRRIHDRLTVEYCTATPAHILQLRFGKPPLPGIAGQIIPLRSAADLVREGELQQNCVATYAPRVANGSTFIYRVQHPERATLSIIRLLGARWEVGELKGKENAKVSKETVAFVQDWLQRYHYA